MNVVCVDCKKRFDENNCYYCFTCENYVCGSCYENHLFQGEDIHRMYRLDEVEYKVKDSSNLKIHCKKCDEIVDFNEYYPNHFTHEFDLIEINPKNDNKKKILISERACGPGIEIMTFNKMDFISMFNHSEDALEKISSHEPVFLLSHTSIKTIEECNYIDYMDQLYVLNEDNMMIEISFYGLYDNLDD